MAQHDYVIANGSGAAVRADLNDALAAIVSLNSGASEPTQTYAYMLWADTTASVLKIRNGADNAWITLRELDGTLVIEGGSAATPGLYFSGDVNTGIYSPGADQFAIATGGVERVEWGASAVVFNDGGVDYDFRIEGDTVISLFFADASTDRIGIGTSSPATRLDVNGDVTIRSQGDLRLGDSDNSNWVALQAPATVSSDITFTLPGADGTANQVLKTDGSGALGWATPLAQGSVITAATASGPHPLSPAVTDIDFTSIPSWVKRITVMFDGISTNGTNAILVQIGDSGGIETTGYESVGTAGVTDTTSTAGFLIRQVVAGDTGHGLMTIALLGSNTWVSSHNLYRANTGVPAYGAGSKTLSATLDRLRITTVGGTNTFDGGTVNIMYEG